jgi:Zn-dependent peptidase ImmA (M78 family)
VDLDEFEQTAGNWVMLWRWLHSMNALDSAPVPDFGIRVQSSYETVRSLSEKLVRWLKLGEAPARSLGPVLEAELGIPVLYVDIPAGVSGATCHFDDGNVILVNRNDSPGRRNFDLAHEFFHVLTWERMPPERIDRSDPETTSAKRREELADNFASALLMPEQEVLQSWTSSADLRVNFDGLLNFVQAGATHFHVSSHAFIWRLVALGKLQKNEALSLIEEFDRVGSTSGEMSEKPPYFSKFFFEQLAVALDEGKISVRRAAKLLALNVDELAEAYLCHDLVVPFDL